MSVEVEKCVWMSGARSWPSNIKKWYDPEREDKKGSLLGPVMYQLAGRARRGEQIDPSEIPDWFYEPKTAKPARKPNFRHFMSNSFFWISPQVRQVFDQFDMGNNLIKPVQLYKSDKKTVAHEGYAVFIISSRKDSFLPEKSPEAYRTYDEETDIWSPPPSDGSGRTINMSSAALEGADIWMEERIFCNDFFLSDRLVQALAGAKLLNLDDDLGNNAIDHNWFIQRCPVIDA